MLLDKLDSHLSRSLPRLLGGLDANRNAGVVECHYPAKLRDNLLQDLQAFAMRSVVRLWTPVSLPPGFAKLSTSPSTTGSVPAQNDDGDVCCRSPCRNGDGGSSSYISG